jgi:monoamine oxidase
MAANPLWVQIEDQARNQDICSQRDLQTDPAHPEIMDDRGRKPLLYGRLHLAGAETSAISPGLIEGALNAGSQAALAVTRLRSRQR